MSRIEEALEKAAQLRKKYGESEKWVKKETPLSVADAGTQPVYPSTPDTAEIQIDNPLLVTYTEPSSPVSEEYRKLKSVIMKMTKKENYLNTLMVTSAFTCEGKSLTALNLAITMAQEYDHTILLVDADIRRPALHEYLGVKSNTGLTDCLLNGTELSAALIRTGIGKLSFLPIGKGIQDPVELLSSNRMKEFLADIKHRYPDRYIIIDAPPVLSCAETLAMGHMVDGIIFVVKEGAASLQDVKEGLGLLKDANILGLVYNNARAECLGGYYSHYYRKYGKEEEKSAPA